MRVTDLSTTGLYKKMRNAFWCTIGGKIEQYETLEQAAYLEILEETGFEDTDVELGPIVWHGVHQMIISDVHIELDEIFIVAHLKSDKELKQDNFTENEKSVVTHTEWLELNEILLHNEPIFQAIFKMHLSDIIAGKYPKQPLLVDLSLQPSHRVSKLKRQMSGKKPVFGKVEIKITKRLKFSINGAPRTIRTSDRLVRR